MLTMKLRLLFMFLNEVFNVIVTCVFLVSDLNYNSCHIGVHEEKWMKTWGPQTALNYHQKPQIWNQVTIELTSFCWQIFAQPLYDMFETAFLHMDFRLTNRLRYGIRFGYVGELDSLNWFVTKIVFFPRKILTGLGLCFRQQYALL